MPLGRPVTGLAPVAQAGLGSSTGCRGHEQVLKRRRSRCMALAQVEAYWIPSHAFDGWTGVQSQAGAARNQTTVSRACEVGAMAQLARPGVWRVAARPQSPLHALFRILSARRAGARCVSTPQDSRRGGDPARPASVARRTPRSCALSLGQFGSKPTSSMPFSCHAALRRLFRSGASPAWSRVAALNLARYLIRRSLAQEATVLDFPAVRGLLSTTG